MSAATSDRSGDLGDVAWRLLAAVGAGSLVGALVGGVGGRVAMLVLRLGSPDVLDGIETDDGFAIGRVSGASLFLLMVAAGLGGVAGATYLAVRDLLPRRGGRVLWAATAGLVLAADLLKPGAFDFVALDPAAFAVVAFTLLPVVGAAGIAATVEAVLGRGRPAPRWLVALLCLGALPLVPIAPALLLLGGVLLVLRRWPALVVRLGPAGRALVPLAFVALALWAGLEVVRDARAIIG